jgi:hypothetical protein
VPNSYSKGSSNRDSNNIKPAGIKLQGLRNSKYNPGLDLKKKPEPIKEEETKPNAGQTDIERGPADDERSVGESEDAILSNEEEERYRIDPREHWRRISLAIEESSMQGARIATPEQNGGRLSRVSTRSSDAVGVAQ